MDSTFNPYAFFGGLLSLGLALAGILAIVKAVRGVRRGTVLRDDVHFLGLAVALAELFLIPMGLLFVLFAFIPPQF